VARREVTREDIARGRKAGEAWLASLDNRTRGDLGDDLVLGMFDWRDWFDDPPRPGFVNGAADALQRWEETQ